MPGFARIAVARGNTVDDGAGFLQPRDEIAKLVKAVARNVVGQAGDSLSWPNTP